MGAAVFRADRELLVAGRTLTLTGPEGHHAATVRRVRVGERVLLTDGAGRLAGCQVSAVGRDRLDLAVVHVVDEPVPQPRLVVVQALPKGDRGETAVETLTEVGVDVVVPWSAKRCVTRWRDERGVKALARWRTTAVEAAKQARRAHWPQVTDPMSTPEVADRLRAAALAVVLHEEAGRGLAGVALPTVGEVVVVVGPEGGLTPEELAVFEAAGGLACRLGPTVLRTSTAGTVAAGVLLAATVRWR